jgi:hypothetical protein
MKSLIVAFAVGVGLAAVMLCAPEPGAGQAAKKAGGKGGRNWHADYAAARAEARAAGKPMFVVFRCQP